jgi:methylaspartate mutase sigma subunit
MITTTTNKQTVVLSGVRSDSHTWNLAYLKLWLEERNFQVINLGSCVPAEELAAACMKCDPSLVILSSVNGHGAAEALDVIQVMRSAGCKPELPVTIGGKLTTSLTSDGEARSSLLRAGFAGVFSGPKALTEFEAYLVEAGLATSWAPVLEPVAA